ncbi:cysteine desulfurase [Rhodopseudomonas rhenobacensis]|uniref:Cysteine desulfurase n=1 Tax=Rhodopseudomonas rhenobacensis TaxID=87461 RepID=A0A7W7Z0U9_9BRAD|nr:cysteine desulfurase family protein [Rhodopseudomonas rhenobacensis]MBB5045853.1 cysteine desulfurase [Rhodopseudomonas rhenobacensis]
MTGRVYLDWNATTPLREEARAAMAAAFELGNPSAVHAEGRRARGAVEEARAAVAAAVGARPQDVIFTSGGTEANALALTPGLKTFGKPLDRLIISSIEHASVLAGGRFATDRISAMAVDRSGVVDLEHLKLLLEADGPALVSVMLANNETGAIQPIAAVAELVHRAGGLLHVDAVQAFGKIPIDIKQLGADLVSVSAHKIGGPKGVGALILAEGVAISEPLLRGGGQEQGRRAGTENVAGIVGFGAAVKAAIAALPGDAERMQKLRQKLEKILRQTQGSVIFASDVPRLPNTTLVGLPGLKAETAVIGFDLAGIAVSSGSACSSGKVQPSHVLRAMQVDEALTRSAIRISLGWTTTEGDVERCAEAWRKLIGSLITRDDETELERFQTS